MPKAAAQIFKCKFDQVAVLIFTGSAYHNGMKEIKPVITNNTKFTSHSVNVVDRKKTSMTGVGRVEGATETEITLTTCMGRLIVGGSELKIVKFDDSDGNLVFTGNVDIIKYAQNKPSLLKRIFK